MIGGCGDVRIHGGLVALEIPLAVVEGSLGEIVRSAGLAYIESQTNQCQNLNQKSGIPKIILKALEKLLFYVLIVGLLVIALRIIHSEVPRHAGSLSGLLGFGCLGLRLIIYGAVYVWFFGPLMFRSF
jgi:hypothetical protein